MKYDFTVQPAILDDHQLASQAGWITLYHYDAESLEYASAGMEYLPLGVGLPAHSVADAPIIQPKTGMALVRDLTANQWVTVADHRHQTAYDIETKHESIIFALGPIPKNKTLIQPMHEFDTWTGTAWEVDQQALKASHIAAASQQKTALINQVSEHINILLDAIAMDNQQTDIQQLAALKHYRVALMRINTSAAPEIDWPELPQ
ncbi:putative phage tail fiber assembly protein [Yersinia enterocolitica]|uniref:tail fiber assembly protein n=1 Tax=Yersinia enterocolitica TaxID=630 RepID=UPI00050678C8|nr:tail fiber assembly protein [Yersinia enterocolitica]AJI82869.1 caudovirales tail fiber assembly family protein [Yersinia enterocolitica]KGA70395.1 caudovirales tail fiber assembly family protein [Yersinia enterocolitica]KGA77142.1 caudovirales tail fiber assembly family protein [Yersinia enterocolitica]MCE3129697.1 tail fiber assembly protein [Yersinia enterocolitica]PNM14421.1 phage tail protein [Yersinia enterocolitica]